MTVVEKLIVAVVVFLLLATYFLIVVWVVEDAKRRGISGSWIIVTFLGLGVIAIPFWFLLRPSIVLDVAPDAHQDPEDALAAASKLDALGEWELAIDVYMSAADRWPEHRDYSNACIDSIHEKQSTE